MLILSFPFISVPFSRFPFTSKQTSRKIKFFPSISSLITALNHFGALAPEFQTPVGINEITTYGQRTVASYHLPKSRSTLTIWPSLHMNFFSFLIRNHHLPPTYHRWWRYPSPSVISPPLSPFSIASSFSWANLFILIFLSFSGWLVWSNHSLFPPRRPSVVSFPTFQLLILFLLL